MRWAMPLVEAAANIRAANKTAFMTIPLNPKCHQLNDAKSNYQHSECYVIVIEPMPSDHAALPA
jgi:hypothetical protein